MIYITCDICGGKATYYTSIQNYDYYSCIQCNMAFLHPYPSPRELQEYYEGPFTYVSGLHNKKELKRKAHRIVRKMIGYNPSGYHFLDIGSGYGYVLEELVSYDMAAMGIEPSFYLWRHSRSLELDVLHSSFEEWTTQLRFDFISLVHVIEHVADPKKFLEKVASFLKPGGILYIETPNVRSFQFYAEGKQYTYMTPPDHVRLFSERSLAIILPPELTPISLKTYTEHPHVKNILKSMLTGKTTTGVVANVYPVVNNRSPKRDLGKTLKHFVVDTIVAPLLSPVCNVGGYGSILELYYQKKS